MFENPIFSPGGEWLAYWSLQDRQLKKIATVGGTPVSLAEVLARPNGISWDVDDTILYGASEGIMRVSADGGSQNFSSRVWRKQILDIHNFCPVGMLFCSPSRVDKLGCNHSIQKKQRYSSQDGVLNMFQQDISFTHKRAHSSLFRLIWDRWR